MQRTLYNLDWDGTGKVAAKIHKDAESGDYVVQFYKNGMHYAPGDYFTSDKVDAIGTAFLELERMGKKG